MSNEMKDNPGVIAPPPLIFLSGLLLGGLINWFYPLYIFPARYLLFARIVGTLLIVLGLGIIFNVRAKMQRVETNIEPWKPTNSIITEGIYAYSRNPVYVAMILIYFGVTIIVDSMWILSFIFLVFFVMHFGVILREEKYLEKKFGEEYLNYKNKVRRWI
jgi:protein-S-isoprenylcysteine O-methyltransferase Ste14